MMENETHRPASLLVWPTRQKCVECGAERQMAGIFPLTEWQTPDGHIGDECQVEIGMGSTLFFVKKDVERW